jgi:predicted secreted protein with PEFG-CTERM motif
MNFKNSTRSICLVLMAVALMSVTSVHQDVFAKDSGMAVTATAAEEGNIISITGETTSNQGAVTLSVIAPNGNLVSIDQVSPDASGGFATDILVGGPLWSQDGMYGIKVHQGATSLYTFTLYVEVIGGVTAETSTGDSSFTSDSGVTSTDAIALAKALSDERGLWITANAMEGSDTIEITGTTSHTNQDVIFTVIAPNGNLVSIDQVSPDANGGFATDISVGGPLWSQDGVYTVTAQQGDPQNGSIFTDSVEVEIADGLVVPEFGTIAAMILAVAIISIIAISAKSRLSIVPRY